MKILKSHFILISRLLLGVYLANLDAGFVEIIPDNLPVVGNLDDFIASLIPLNSLAYFGLDLRRNSHLTWESIRPVYKFSLL